jgi:hypothetical protein
MLVTWPHDPHSNFRECSPTDAILSAAAAPQYAQNRGVEIDFSNVAAFAVQFDKFALILTTTDTHPLAAFSLDLANGAIRKGSYRTRRRPAKNS